MTPATRSIAFIDSRVADYQTLIDGLSDPMDVYLLDSDSDGLSQIAAYLKGQAGYDALHIVSHGSEGTLFLGNSVIDGANLADYQSQLQSIGNSMTETGDILLYGCNVAQGTNGQAFIDQIARYAGADVAASNNLTGAARLGGDWVLEQTKGYVEADALHISDYAATLIAGPSLVGQTQTVADAGTYIEIGTLFAILSYGDGSLGAFSGQSVSTTYSNLTDEGFDDNYRGFLENNLQLGKRWQLLTDSTSSTNNDAKWKSAWDKALEDWHGTAESVKGDYYADHATINYADFTFGGLYNAFISTTDIGIGGQYMSPSQYSSWVNYTNPDRITLTNPFGTDWTKPVTTNWWIGDSNALVAKSADGTLVLAFRGTDEFDNSADGGQTHIGDGQFLHYEAFRPLIEAAYAYANDSANGVKHIVVSGHSLGASMVDVFTLVDAGRFAAITASDLTIVSIASPGLDPNVITDGPSGYGYSDRYDQGLATVSSNFGVASLTLEPTTRMSKFYHGFSHDKDRVYHAELDESVLLEGAGGVLTGDFTPNTPIEGNSNFGATTLNLPSISNFDVTYSNNYGWQSTYKAHGFGADHNGQIYWRDIHALYSSELYSHYSDQNLIFGRGQFATLQDWFQAKTLPGQLSDQGQIALDGTDQADFIFGLEGNDLLRGLAADDLLDGGAGNDTLDGGADNDILCAGIGFDSVDGGLGTDTLIITRDLSGPLVGGATYEINGSALNSGSSFASLVAAFDSAITTYVINFSSIGKTTATNIENYIVNLTGTYDNDLLVYQNGTRYDGSLGTDTFYANWGINTTGVSWANDPNSQQTVNGISIAGVERLLLTTGTGADYISNTTVTTNDFIQTGRGNDEVHAGAGDDEVYGWEDDDTLFGDAGRDTLNGGIGNDHLFDGGDNNDDIDHLYGDAGNDTLISSGGNDYMSGGTGSDTYSYESTNNYLAIVSDLGDGNDLLRIKAPDADFTKTRFVVSGDNLFIDAFTTAGSLIRSAVISDMAHAAGQIETLEIDLGTGANAASGRYNLVTAWNAAKAGDDTGGAAYLGSFIGGIYTGDGADNVIGTIGDDWIHGRGGNDTINGLSGSDHIFGDEGNDTITITNGTVDGGAGNDTCNITSIAPSGDSGYTVWRASTTVGLVPNGDIYYLSTYAQVSAALSAGTTFILWTGLDAYYGTWVTQYSLTDVENWNILEGSSSNDLLFVRGSGTTYNGAGGTDTLYADWSAKTGAVAWTNTGAAFTYDGVTISNVERLLLKTGSGNDNINNTASITNDYIDTGAGNDTLDGGAGNDTLNGGSGDDQAVYVGNRTNYSIARVSGGFSVTDMAGNEGVDTIVGIEALVFAEGKYTLDADGNLTLSNNAAPTGSVTISGTATQGSTLTAANTLADADGLGTIAYQWNVDGSVIAGATGSLFVLTQSQVGKAITVTASYTDGHGTLESVASGATGLVTGVSVNTPPHRLGHYQRHAHPGPDAHGKQQPGRRRRPGHHHLPVAGRWQHHRRGDRQYPGARRSPGRQSPLCHRQLP
jgi:Ca2+-binding RTX toxin-like protein